MIGGSMLLAGDIGGTKTELAVFSPERGPRVPLAHAQFASMEYPNLSAIVRAFLTQVRLPILRACFDVAGPVIDGRVQVTNLPWVLDEQELGREFNLTAVHLLNDLEALAHAVPLLQSEDLRTLNAGEPVAEGAIAVIAPGTGLGEAFLTWDGATYIAHASEGGHADFAPTDDVQIGLLRDMLHRYDHVSYEHVCSGIGIPHIYDYLRENGSASESAAIAQRFALGEDRTPVICDAALHPAVPDPLSVAALDTFLTILGAEAGNLALKVLATGGVYIGGGISIHVAAAFNDGRFMAAFRRKGRFADVLTRMPVHLIVRQAALIGAAQYGLTRLRERDDTER